VRQVLKTIRGIVFLSNATDAPVPDIDTDLLQFFGHSWAAIAAQAQARLLLDMRQNHHIHALPAAGRTAAERPQSAGADIHHPTQPIDRESPALFFNEPEPHGFWLAKNWSPLLLEPMAQSMTTFF